MRSAPCTPRERINSENVIVATPLGPNQAMKMRSGRGTLVPAQRHEDRDRPRQQQRARDQSDARPAVEQQLVEGEQRTEHREDRPA